MESGVSAVIRAGLHLLLSSSVSPEVMYNGSVHNKWSKLKAAAWQHLVSASRTLVNTLGLPARPRRRVLLQIQMFQIERINSIC